MKNVLNQFTAAHIASTIAAHGGNKHKAGQALGVHGSSILRWLTRNEVEPISKGPTVEAPEQLHEYFRRATALDAKSQDRGNDIPQRQFPTGANRFVITCAVNATPVHTGFLGALEGYCGHVGAELLVIPLRYKNPTSQWTTNQDRDDWWSAELAPYIFAGRVHLAKDLVLLGDLKTQPTAADPLTGLHALTGSASSILGHPQIALTTIPTPQNKLPKIVTSTGAVTVPNYSATKAGARGEFSHSLGACVVEIEDDGEGFHVRHVNADDSGAFHDFEYEYLPDGSRRENGGVAALVMGDSHIDFIDPEVVKATFTGADAIVSALNPAFLVWHDILDCYSVSHHHQKDPLIQFTKHHSGRANIRHEVQRCFAFIDQHSPAHCKNVIVGSNHSDHLGQWVRGTDPREDPENALIWAELYHAMCTAATMGTGGAETLDPLKLLASTGLQSFKRTIWPGRGESFPVHGVELTMHGDKGPNGARGSRKALDKIGTKSIIGHSHSPGISGGCYQTGTSSRYNLEYAASSPSSWLQSHVVLYKNGKRTLVHCIGGRWRLPSPDIA